MSSRQRSITRVMEQVYTQADFLGWMSAGEGFRIASPDSTECQRVTGLVTLLSRVSAVTYVLDDATSLSSFQSTLVAPVLQFAGGAVLWLSHYLGTDEILVSILHEREQQDETYGAAAAAYRASEWAAALTEEIGELAREAFRADRKRGHELRTELVQVAALAVWWLEILQLRGEGERGRLCAESAPAADAPIDLTSRLPTGGVCANTLANKGD